MLDDTADRAAQARQWLQQRPLTIRESHRLPPRGPDRWQAMNRPLPPKLAGYQQHHVARLGDVDAGLCVGQAAWQQDYAAWLRHPAPIPGTAVVPGERAPCPEALGVFLAALLLSAGRILPGTILPRWIPACEFAACEHGIIHRTATEAPLTDRVGTAGEVLEGKARDMYRLLYAVGMMEAKSAAQRYQRPAMLAAGYTLWRCGGEVWDCGCAEAPPPGGTHHP